MIFIVVIDALMCLCFFMSITECQLMIVEHRPCCVVRENDPIWPACYQWSPYDVPYLLGFYSSHQLSCFGLITEMSSQNDNVTYLSDIVVFTLRHMICQFVDVLYIRSSCYDIWNLPCCMGKGIMGRIQCMGRFRSPMCSDWPYWISVAPFTNMV